MLRLFLTVASEEACTCAIGDRAALVNISEPVSVIVIVNSTEYLVAVRL